MEEQRPKYRIQGVSGGEEFLAADFTDTIDIEGECIIIRRFNNHAVFVAPIASVAFIIVDGTS